MNLKRFFAKDMRTAMAQIKEELGSDAIIMSSKKVDGGIEIVAAIDYKVEDSNSIKNGNGADDAPIFPENSGTNNSDDDEYGANNVSISSQGASKSSRSSLKSDKYSSISSENKQEKFADSLAALLMRQNQDNKTTSESTNTYTRSRTSASNAYSNVADNSERPKTLAQRNNLKNPNFGEKNKGLSTHKPIIDKTDVNVQNNEKLNSLSKEVEAIRKLLQFQLAGLMQDERSRDEPVKAMIIRLLTSSGFTSELAEQIVQKITPDVSFNMAWQELARILENNIPCGNDSIMKNGGAIALVGPTGVGKTTTIAKIAARFALKYGSEQVALISTDHYRIGASEQLQTYGRIMGCTVKIVDDMKELSDVLYQLRNKSLVLIDTAGFGQRDARLMQELNDLEKNAGVKLQYYLVLAATAQRRVLEDAYARFSGLGLDGLILTKLDESLNLGDAANLCISHQLELSYITTGQRVPEDIEVANSAYFVERVLSQIEDEEPEFAEKIKRQV